MKRIFGTIIFLLLAILITSQFNLSFANAPSYQVGCLSGNEFVWSLNCVFPLAANIVSMLLTFSGAVAIVLIIYSGIKFMLSSGDPKQIQGARSILTYAVLGLVLIFSSFAIIIFIANTTRVACIDPNQGFSFTNCGEGGPTQYPSCSASCVDSFNACTYQGGTVIGGAECSDPSKTCCDLSKP